jgi:hypothetical protein
MDTGDAMATDGHPSPRILMKHGRTPRRTGLFDLLELGAQLLLWGVIGMMFLVCLITLLGIWASPATDFPLRLKCVLTPIIVGGMAFIAWICWFARRRQLGRTGGLAMRISGWIWSLLVVSVGLTVLAWMGYNVVDPQPEIRDHNPIPGLIFALGCIFVGGFQIRSLIRPPPDEAPPVTICRDPRM